ncbi:MAG: ABC transporter permease subunit [Flavobacteriales bacterium]|nr:ABC transporter permease subunit [Flavobacteriales bacterium]
MLKYVLRRILVFIPTLVAITLLGFVIMISAPGDPVERMVVAAQSGGEVGSQTANQIEQKKFWSRKLGLDLPIFYFSLNSMSQSDTLYRVYDRNERESLSRLANVYGNWPAVSDYFQAIDALNDAHGSLRVDSSMAMGYSIDKVKQDINQSFFESSALKATYSENVIEAKLEALTEIYDAPYMASFRPELDNVKAKLQAMKDSATPWKKYVPVINFYPNNQYHRWIFGDGDWLTGKGAEFTTGVIRGDFGTSYRTKMPISEVISIKIFWSFFFTIISVVLGYLVSMPMGIHAAVNKGSRFDTVTTVLVFILFSIPSFWLATVLLMTFANPDVLYWFPASGVEPVRGFAENAGFFEKWGARLPYLILPIISYTYSSFAFLSRTMRVSMLEIVNQDYIRTARAKGLSETKVVYKHALRNALLPIITVFANIFPVAIGGSVVLEVIFTIPGMGNEVYQAIVNQDYPMVVAVLTITGVLTLVGYLVSDILYAVADPRISYSK